MLVVFHILYSDKPKKERRNKMLKNISRLEHKIEDKVYHFVCDCDSPLSQVKESLFQFLKYVGHIEDQVKTHEEANKSQEKVVEIPKEAHENLG